MKYMKISVIFVLAALLIPGFSVISAAAPSLSNSGGGNWSNYREITITNSGSALTDYQVLVQLSGSSFPTTSSNGADIRFIDSDGNELNYWIESWNNAGRSATIWVKVGSISANGETKIKMFYGNSGANTISNGVKTFEFFDDFSEDTIGINWIRPAGTGAAIVGGQAKVPMALNDAGYLYTTISYKRPLIIESRVKSNRASQPGNFIPFSIGYNDGLEYWKNSYGFTLYGNNLSITKTGKGLVASVSQTTAANTYYILSAILSSSNIITKLYNDERSLLNSVSFNDIDYDNERIMLDTYGADDGYGYYDWVIIRKYASPEPTIALGAEQPVLTPPTTGNISVSSSPTGTEVLVDGASKGAAPVTVPNLSSGSHAVKCKLPGYADYDTSATVTAGATTSVTCSMLQSNGNISVSSSPTGAEVLVDGASKGTAPVTIPNVPPGSHAVKCKLSGYADDDISATVTAGSTYSVICSLVKAGDLSVKLTSEPASIQPGQISTIKISVTKDDAPVSGVKIMLSSIPSVKFSASSGTTTNGEFISTFTTSTEGEIKVSALAKKEGSTDGKGEAVVQVGKITLPNTSKQATITGKVMDAGTDDSVQDVIINVDGKLTVTESNGEYELLVDVGKHNLSASKSGYETMTRSVIVPEVGNVFDLSLKPTSSVSSWFWIGIILLLVVVAAIIYLIYRKKKPKVEGKKEVVATDVEKKKFCMFCHAPMPQDADFCPKCGKKQDETKRFCMNCGALMPAVPELCGKCSKMPPSDMDTKNCKNCGEVIPKVAKFCSACGAGQPE